MAQIRRPAPRCAAARCLHSPASGRETCPALPSRYTLRNIRDRRTMLGKAPLRITMLPQGVRSRIAERMQNIGGKCVASRTARTSCCKYRKTVFDNRRHQMATTTNTTQPGAAIPPDDATNKLTVANPDDPKLRHISIAGGTYTILVTGAQTSGRYCL